MPDKVRQEDVMILKEKQITIPDEILLQYLNETELKSYKESSSGVYSVTVYGLKQKGCGCSC